MDMQLHTTYAPAAAAGKIYAKDCQPTAVPCSARHWDRIASAAPSVRKPGDTAPEAAW